MGKRHLPPGAAMKTVLSPEDFAKLGVHVKQLQSVLVDILQRAMLQGYLPPSEPGELTQLIHGSLASAAERSHGTEGRQAHQARIEATVLFIQRGLGAQFDQDLRPVPLPATQRVLSAAS